MVKIQYRGSANSIPRLGLTFGDGDTLDVPKEDADKLVAENIGFSYTEEKPEKKRR